MPRMGRLWRRKCDHWLTFGCGVTRTCSGKESFRPPLLSLLALTGRNVDHKESVDRVKRATERFSQASFAVPQFGKSMDRQCGRRIEKSATVLRIMEESICIVFTYSLDWASLDNQCRGMGTHSSSHPHADCYSSASTTPQIIASVVSMRDAIEAAFCRAVRATLVGSMTPA